MSKISWRRLLVTLFLLGLVTWLGVDFFVQQQEASKAESEPVWLTGPDAEMQQASSGLEIGDQAPDFKLNDLSGKEVKLSDYRGQEVLVNFWASWCEPCKEEMPVFQSYYESDGQRVEILAVNATNTERSVKDVETFVEANGFTFPILLDRDATSVEDYLAFYLPVTYKIDEEGKISDLHRGPLTHDMMDEWLST
ncbi:redoxin domain-containing protein [Bacillaceae bacterium SIJ1]|uniref:redoxin domain-containing protein n=1 Tax=Litoribacterium kuwaitense TaxID=1398745 RepID=UPI0013EBA74F|nr:redoxin domain-containing protein [Litoribacterium kuwaitense]NGP44244.1 redoxin domain-containing protein [Litoribacterium kuwaitense]